MANYKTHLIGGVITFFLLNFLFSQLNFYTSKATLGNFEMKTIFFCMCLLGSLLPDIDTKSKIQKLLYIVLLLAIIYLLIINKWKFAAFSSPFLIFPIIVNHRGIFHNPIFLAIISSLIATITATFFHFTLKDFIILWLYLYSGTISHLLLDHKIYNKYKK